MSRLLPVAICLFGMVGCKNVKPADLPGTWVMNDASRQVLPVELQKAAARIVLNRDGTFVASDIPALFFFPGHRAARLESGSGTWKLFLSEGRQEVLLEFHEIVDWKKNELPYGTQLNVSRGWSALSLYYFFGDADEGRKIEFAKK